VVTAEPGVKKSGLLGENFGDETFLAVGLRVADNRLAHLTDKNEMAEQVLVLGDYV
jgi:hypothetical protein